jgi:hypothetical protein
MNWHAEIGLRDRIPAVNVGELPSRKSSSELERIENMNIQIRHVGGVACHQCHAMDLGSCRQQAVDNRQWADRVEPSLFIGNRAIDRQNAFAKRLINGFEPILNRPGLSVVLWADSLDGFADFANHQHAQI